ncbi:MAG: sulfotransferase family 2 domain-containing protein [Planctomycetaceae bacterium]|nr:sulfotransferase family 2 domain-containing protein [Planctomycetaceae bacterium]
MLISHEYRFIFIKTRKTAGTSIEISLSRYLGPFDVITPITPRDELMRAEQGIMPRNYLQAVHSPPGVAKLHEADATAMLNSVQIVRRFYNHCPAVEIRAAVGQRIWETYTKFCFERNPWDRVLSEYFFMRKTKPDTFAEMSLDEYIEREFYSLNYPLYSLANRPAVDMLGRFETLQSDFLRICQQLEIPCDGWLPHAKGDSRPDRQTAREVLSPRQIQLIGDRCRLEIDWLGYEQPCAA